MKQGKLDKKCEGYQLKEDYLLVFKGKLYIPNCVDLKKVVMDEIHQIPYYEHSGYQKIITTETKKYFSPRMKKDVVEFITKCQRF